MAIEDNTVYGLTGTQIKELPGKIDAVRGLAKNLTADDYNYPADSPNTIALWLLPNGLYSIPSGVKWSESLRYSSSSSSSCIAIVGGYTAGAKSIIIRTLEYNGTGSIQVAKVIESTGEPQTTSVDTVLMVKDVANSLTSTSTTNPLSAAQGKALKDLIDAIVVPTKTSELTNDSGFVTSSNMDTALSGKADIGDVPTTLSELTNDINAVSDANYVHTDNNYTMAEKNKLSGIATGAEVNVQSDWSVTSTTSDAYIKNKPTIPTKVSQLTNDSGYTSNAGTITAVQVNGTSVATSGKANIPTATTSRYGATQLSTSTSSTSTSLAATPSAVKAAYDLASGKATITMTTTDPGEGSALAANNFIAVYAE